MLARFGGTGISRFRVETVDINCVIKDVAHQQIKLPILIFPLYCSGSHHLYSTVTLAVSLVQTSSGIFKR